MSLERDVKELRAKLAGETIGPPVLPMWTGDLGQWVADWLLYWNARRYEVYDHWFSLMKRHPPPSSDEQQAGRIRLEWELREYALEKITRIHPQLMGLADRWNHGEQLSGSPGAIEEPNMDDPRGWSYTVEPTGDYAVAAFRNSLYPKAPLDEFKKPPKSWGGFSTSPWIGKYQKWQVMVSAKEGYTMYELAERDLSNLTPEDAAQAKLDCDTYKIFSDYDETLHLPMVGMPVEYYKLAVAYGFGKMNDKEWQNAADWLTLELMRPLIEPDKPMPYEEGWSPPVPLDDPHWQDATHTAQAEKAWSRRGRKD